MSSLHERLKLIDLYHVEIVGKKLFLSLDPKQMISSESEDNIKTAIDMEYVVWGLGRDQTCL